MSRFSLSPLEMFSTCWRHRYLLKSLTKREIIGRYRGSYLGVAWSLLNPLFMLAVYTFVFSVVFEARWGSENGSKIEFALALFCGMIVFNIFSECVNRAPNLILSNVNYVKKLVFPLELLSWVNLGASAFHLVVSLLVWLIFYVVFFGLPHLTTFLFPLVILPTAILALGLSWLISATSVYFRDLGQIISVFLTALLFLSPIFYPTTALPKQYQQILQFNPLTPAIEQTRSILITGQMPNWQMWSFSLLFSTVIAWVGFIWFQKTRQGFADVL